MTWSTVDSPIGELTVVAEDGALVGLYMTGHRPAPDPESFGERVDDALPAATAQLAEYFAGQRQHFDLPLDMSGGTAFQQAVWRALTQIAPGSTTRYGALAAQLGQPTAVRAVGAAVGRNPVSVIVPCHRVLGADGSLTGYAGGLPRKQALLDLEGAASARLL